MILKNTASQGCYLFASDKTTGVGLAGDQANITGSISKDGAAEAAFATANPTNIGGGLYWQPLSQAETNANAVGLRWTSTTANILIDPLVGFTDQGRINDTITSRASQASLDAVDDYVDTEVAAIKAKTDLIPASPATEGTLSTIASYIDTEVAAIKAKTDTLPSDPADASDVAAALAAIQADTNDLQARLPAALVSGRMDSYMGAADPSLPASGGGATAAEIAAEVWATAPAGTPLEEIAEAVWAAVPTGTAVEEIAEAVWAAAPAAIAATLVPTGLDAISTALAGLPANFRERLVWLCCRHDDTTKTLVDPDSSVILVRNLDGDPVTEQDVTTSATQITISNVRSPA